VSRFEYVSVAVALLYSIGVGRLLTSIPDVFDQGRRYWVHAAWVVGIITSRPVVHAGLVSVMLVIATTQFVTNVNSSLE
jgi:hypothetical protein